MRRLSFDCRFLVATLCGALDPPTATCDELLAKRFKLLAGSIGRLPDRGFRADSPLPPTPCCRSVLCSLVVCSSRLLTLRRVCTGI